MNWDCGAHGQGSSRAGDGQTRRRFGCRTRRIGRATASPVRLIATCRRPSPPHFSALSGIPCCPKIRLCCRLSGGTIASRWNFNECSAKISEDSHCDDSWPRVLVVEDDESMRVAIERLLNAAGFATAAYASADELLAAGARVEMHAWSSDLALPGTSGLELLGALRARGWMGSLILITAHDSPSVRQKAEQSGVAMYLAKPFDGSSLVAAVRKAMGAPGTGCQA